MKQIFSADDAGIGKATEHIRHILDKGGIKGKENSKTVLAAEEAMGELVSHAKEGSELIVTSRIFLGTIVFELSAAGGLIDIQELTPEIPDIWEISDSSVGTALRHLILRSMWKDLRYKHKKGVNTMRLTVARTFQALVLTLGAMIAAILLGILLTASLPKDLLNAFDDNFLTPVRTMYINALKMIAAPIVFFSIAVCFSKQANPAGLGRIGIKILALYTITTVIATAVGIGVYYLFQPGDPSAAAGLAQNASAIAAQAQDISIRDTIIGIVPDNFFSPFLYNDMLSLLFIAVLVGLAIGLIGDYSAQISVWFEGCCELFMKIASIIMRVTPFAVFCSILSMVLRTGPGSLISVLSMFGTFLFGLAVMICVYSVILILSGQNPLLFFKRYIPTMIQVFSIASSNAAISLNMDACKNDLGISSDIYSLSIPLGATINMDGTCVLMAVQSLTLAKVFGVNVPTGALLTLAVSIIVLSVGAPGVPGSGVIMMSILLSQLGVPVEGVALVIGIGPLVGMFISMCNCLGDVIVTKVVDKSES